jgi:hypothetical protein
MPESPAMRWPAPRFTIFNHKGGVGKTTLIFNIASAMVESGLRVLLVDSDPQCNLGVETKDSKTMYTSVHYIVEANTKTKYTAEIQVRTLAEELWGEVDHTLNYPHESKVLACREQIKVLARVTSSCSRLVDSIFTSHQDAVSPAPVAEPEKPAPAEAPNPAAEAEPPTAEAIAGEAAAASQQLGESAEG